MTLSPRLLDLLSLLGYYAANSPGLLIRLARVLAHVTDYHMHVLGRHAGVAARTMLARTEHQKVSRPPFCLFCQNSVSVTPLPSSRSRPNRCDPPITPIYRCLTCDDAGSGPAQRRAAARHDAGARQRGAGVRGMGRAAPVPLPETIPLLPCIAGTRIFYPPPAVLHPARLGGYKIPLNAARGWSSGFVLGTDGGHCNI